MQLREFAVAAVIAGVGDQRGGLGGLGLRLGAGGFFAGEGGGNVEGEARALRGRGSSRNFSFYINNLLALTHQ